MIDELTSLPKDLGQLDQALPADRKLRIDGGGNLLAAAEALGVKRYLQQSSGFYLAARGGLTDETAPMRVDAPVGTGASAAMYAELERRVLTSSRLQGTALRYGFLYGPGTWYWTDGAAADQVRRGESSIMVAARPSGPLFISTMSPPQPSRRSRQSPAFIMWSTMTLARSVSSFQLSPAGSTVPSLAPSQQRLVWRLRVRTASMLTLS